MRLLQRLQVTWASAASSQNWPLPVTQFPEAEGWVGRCVPAVVGGWEAGFLGSVRQACKVNAGVWGEGRLRNGTCLVCSFISKQPSVAFWGPKRHSVLKRQLFVYYNGFVYTFQRFYTCSLLSRPCSVNSSQRYTQSHVPSASELTAHT